MKILFIGSDRNLFKNGSDIWNRYLDYGKLFEEIHVIVFSHKNLGNTGIKIGDNVFIYPTNHIFKLFYLWNIYKISKRISKSSSLVVGRKLWVASSQDPFESGLAAWMLKRIYRIPLQIQIHTDFLSKYFKQESFINKLRVILAKFLIPRADGIRVVSERIKASLVASGYSLIPITVLPIFVDTETIKTSLINVDLHNKYPQFNFIILMASRLTKEKNIGLAIEAMAELIKKYPKPGLIIVGSGSEEVNLKLLARPKRFREGRGIEDNIVLEPWSDNLSSYYKTADLFLLTSNYEGYGRSIVESMSVGLPVIMTDVGLAGEVVINGKNGIVVPIGDVEAIVDSISSLIIDKNKRNELSANAFKIKEDLMTKEEYLELYKRSIEALLN